ncbi:MAG: peptidoglycan DD-metalloendopeptidase family protein [Clostridia bacterium]|nr:peptidoglycan DD-metalloendopeptidase family protein [Clostridia bacterium]
MDHENEKLNLPQGAANDAEDILDGIIDLDELYGTPEQQRRAEELRARDESRRARELQAVREDIERRYSMTVESMQQPESERRKPMIDVDGDAQRLRDSLTREVEALMQSDGYGGAQQSAPREKKAAEKPAAQREAPASGGGLYNLIYRFGDAISRVLAAVFGLLFRIISFPFVRMFALWSEMTRSVKLRSRAYIRELLRDVVRFRREVRSTRKNLRRAARQPLSFPAVLGHLILKALRRHKDLFKTTLNLLLPAGALVVLLLTIHYWNSVTFALEVIYNDNSIGYISDESVYIEARDMVKDRLSATETVEQTTAAQANLNARYTLSLVSLEELDDAQSISDKIIENSVENLTHACGIYIDGTFICAVKNEADAKTVFYDIIEPYEADAQANGYVVGFAENIDYVQGLYRDDADIMWDAAQLEAKLTGSGSAIGHTVTEEDSLESILSMYGVTASYLQKKNPEMDLDRLQPGDRLVIRSAERMVNIKKTVTTSTTRPIAFETMQRRDATKYSGYRSVIQPGVDGLERVTTTVTYVNDVEMSTTQSFDTIREAVDEVVVVGTKTSVNGVYIGSVSNAGFLWPAPSCHYVSSPYGWRSSGWHSGIDLVVAGGGAYGTPVIASRSGVVEVVQRSNSGYGNMVLINHGDGYKTRYAHMITGSITVSVGDYVEGGQTIGQVGSTGNSTGPHLHFEVIYNGETQNPKNYIF